MALKFNSGKSVETHFIFELQSLEFERAEQWNSSYKY